MYRSRYHGKRLLNGYSGYTPPAAVIANRAMDRFPSSGSPWISWPSSAWATSWSIASASARKKGSSSSKC